MQVALGRHERPVAGDLPQYVHGNPGVGHPGESGVSQVVADQVLVPERPHDPVPMGRVPQDRRPDPATLGTCEQSGVRPAAAGSLALTTDRISSMSGTSLARLSFVPLSISPPGPRVVCRRTVRSHVLVSMSRTRTPETSPIRAAVAAAKTTTSPQPAKRSPGPPSGATGSATTRSPATRRLSRHDNRGPTYPSRPLDGRLSVRHDRSVEQHHAGDLCKVVDGCGVKVHMPGHTRAQRTATGGHTARQDRYQHGPR